VFGEGVGEHLLVQFLEAALLALLVRAHLNIIIGKGRRSGILGGQRLTNVHRGLLWLLWRLGLFGLQRILIFTLLFSLLLPLFFVLAGPFLLNVLGF
jgi:hypothetical protein